jgi:16S rRNA (uracil1498-N3)-methyltransferase
VGRAHHRRFFLSPEGLAGGQAVFGPAQAHQLVSVLRLGAGDRIAVFDGTGREWTAELTQATPRRAQARLLAEHPPEAPSRLAVTLAQVAPRGAAMDLIVAKATELGVSRIVPLEAEHSVRRTAASGGEARWRRIIVEATEQCGRRRLPELAPACAVEDYLRMDTASPALLVCDQGGGARPLAEVCGTLLGAAEVTLLVGGEGGFSPEEVVLATRRGGRRVSLGPRLLRAETAALAALAVVQACAGDWSSPDGGAVAEIPAPRGGRVA